MAATALKLPLMIIDDAEALQLAQATIAVGEQYAVTIAPKTLAWLQFAGAVFAVYGPRVYTAMVMLKMKKQEEQKPHNTLYAASPGPASPAAAPIDTNRIEVAGGKLNLGG